MATQSKKKHDKDSAKTKANSSIGNTGKNPRDKQKLHHSQVSHKTKKKVSSRHPLAKVINQNPSNMDVEIDDSIDDILEESDILESDNQDNFDIESLSDQSVMPSGLSDSIIPLAENGSQSNLTLEVPVLPTILPASVSSPIYKFTSVPDGTQRVSVTLNFDDTFRADDYEIRISS